jgi:hypothetical protein
MPPSGSASQIKEVLIGRYPKPFPVNLLPLSIRQVAAIYVQIGPAISLDAACDDNGINM